MKMARPGLSNERWRGLADVVGRLLVVYATIAVLNWFLDRPPSSVPSNTRPAAALLPLATVTDQPTQLVPPTLPPTLVPVPVAPTARPQISTPTPVREQAAGSPAQRVALFYRLLDQSDFDYLPELMSEGYRKTLPDPSSLRDRLDPGHMQLMRNETFLETPTLAGVLVDVREVLSLPRPFTNRYVGVWWLISSPAGWLLDKPDLELQGE